MPVPVLALDLATSTGWALRDRAGTVTSGTARFNRSEGETLGGQLVRFRRWLRSVLSAGGFGPRADLERAGVIAYERPLVVARGFKAGIGKELEAMLLVEAAENSLDALSVAPSTLKKHATGNGAANKHAMLAAAVKRWGLEAQARPGGRLPSDDEADALCALAWAIEQLGEAVHA